MKVLCVNSVYSQFGGVEIAAINLASGLADRGHEVHFLAAKGHKAQLAPSNGGTVNSEQRHTTKIHCHYRKFPRTHPLGENHGFLRKFLWHVQDLVHPTNEALFAEVLGRVQPHVIILHNITAVGLNIWRPIRKSGIPCIQVVHDLSLICLNMSRFRAGRQCSGLCTACRIQKLFRFSLITDAPNFAFVSPSHATLQEIERYVDLSSWTKQVISNPNDFFVKPRKGSMKPRLLYIGRLDAAKGVDVMLRSADLAHQSVEFELDILGAGSLEQSLRQKYRDATWLKFHGSVDQDTVAEFMSQATALLVPSLWLETVPGVAVHALFAGLPVLGSSIGGIPEHVVDGKTGRLLPPGDEKAWSDEIVRVVTDKEQVVTWSAGSLEAARRFDPKIALDGYETLIHHLAQNQPNEAAK